MENPSTVILAIVAFGVLFVLVPLIIFTVGYYRTARMTVCPETGSQVNLDIDAVHAGLTAAAGRPRLRVRWCTLWPQKRGCAQECVAGGEIRRPPARPGA